MNCGICNHKLGLAMRPLSIAVLGSTVDVVVCPICYDVVTRLRSPNRSVITDGQLIKIFG